MKVKVRAKRFQHNIPCEKCDFKKEIKKTSIEDTAKYYCPFGAMNCIKGEVSAVS